MQAQREGYAARSVYKLIEIQQKHAPLQAGHTVIDIGAAPGGWSQYSSSVVGARGRVYAIDTRCFSLPAALPNVSIMEGDIFDERVVAVLQRYRRSYNGLLSDAAPSTSGTTIVDAARSFEIAGRVVSLIPRLLARKGYTIVKCFWSERSNEIARTLRNQFQRVYIQRPRATRSRSKECYFTALGYTGG